jgi:hypothetical protein
MDELKSDEVNLGDCQPEYTLRGPSVWRSEVKIAVGALGFAVLAIALFNWPKPQHHNAQLLDKNQAIEAFDKSRVPAKPDPDAFDEKRDGSHALSAEDEAGDATIWRDKTSGVRIFCATDTGPCLILPPAPATTKADKAKGKTSGL